MLINIAQRLVDHSDCAIRERFTYVDADCDVGQLFSDESKIDKGFTERLALLRIG